MNIYAKEGHKVKPIFVNGQLQHGYDLERSEAAKYLKEGIVYTVEKISVLDWSSTVYLKEFPGVPFNTVHFEDYAEPIDPELISIDHSEGELPVDGLLDAMERGAGEKKEEFLPPDNGDVCWTIGAETFTRKEVFMLLHTQRSMITNDLKRYAGNDLTENIYAVLNFPRKPEF